MNANLNAAQATAVADGRPAMTTTFTPGPWSVHERGGRLLIDTDTAAVAFILCYDKEAQANADLIAAAPDLLTTLDEFISAVEGVVLEGGSVYIDRTSSGWFGRARAAIIKAKGGVQ